MIQLTAVVISTIALLAELLLIVRWKFYFIDQALESIEWPTVDILVASRNEEYYVSNCVTSLLALSYPTDKIIIWLADDASNDSTWSIIEQFSSLHSNINALQITERTILGNGKANAIAQLAKKGKSEWIFTTDADIEVPTTWIKAMLQAAISNKAALVTGTSVVKGDSFLATYQRLDWLYATSMLKVVSDSGVPVSTMGNNMAIKRSVYEEIGGFEALKFSVTEDLELFREVVKNHKAINLFSDNVLNKSAPQSSFIELLIQRKRWMRGAFELPYQLLALLIIQAAYYPAILILISIDPVAGLLLWVTKWFLKYSYLKIAGKKIMEKVSALDSFVSEWVTIIFSMASLIYYFWPSKIYWKGRRY